MAQNLRKPEILDLIRQHGRVVVEDLVAHFGVSAQTIRRDLTELAETGQIERLHGGAVLPSGTFNIAYAERRALQAEAKARIGAACAARIPNNAAVFLNIGSTTEAVAQNMRGHTGVLVVTNNLNIATILGEAPGVDVIVTGGILRAADNGLVGEMARRALLEFRFDVAVIGCSALHADGDILDYDADEVSVSRTALSRAATRILAADSTKFERTAPQRIASMADMDCIVMDGALPDPAAQLCDDAGIEVAFV